MRDSDDGTRVPPQPSNAFADDFLEQIGNTLQRVGRIEDVLHAVHDEGLLLILHVEDAFHAQQFLAVELSEQLHRVGHFAAVERFLECQAERADAVQVAVIV